MAKFVISDTHFDHQRIIEFVNEATGKRVREFETLEQMNRHIIDLWNATVTDEDTVYHLGDLLFGERYEMLKELKGKKTLILGNHDKAHLTTYYSYFDRVTSGDAVGKYILTHVPVHPNQLAPHTRFSINVHGHLHEKSVLLEGSTDLDPRYRCVSVEQTDYKPILLNSI